MKAQSAKVIEGGKIVVPAAMRRELGLKTGDTVSVRVEDGELRVQTVEQAFAHALQLLRSRIPKGVSLVDELIADRRAEAAGE